MQAELQRAKRRNGNVPGVPFKPGMNSRKLRQLKIDAKADELRREYFPNGGMGTMATNRIKLAASHYIDAELCRDPIVRQRATRCAEYLLSKITPPPAPRPPAVTDLEQELWRDLEKGGPWTPSSK